MEKEVIELYTKEQVHALLKDAQSPLRKATGGISTLPAPSYTIKQGEAEEVFYELAKKISVKSSPHANINIEDFVKAMQTYHLQKSMLQDSKDTTIRDNHISDLVMQQVKEAIECYPNKKENGTSSIHLKTFELLQASVEKATGELMSQNLKEVYIKYIQLLGDEVDELTAIAHNRGWRSTRVEKGEELRKQIEILSTLPVSSGGKEKAEEIEVNQDKAIDDLSCEQLYRKIYDSRHVQGYYLEEVSSGGEGWPNDEEITDALDDAIGKATRSHSGGFEESTDKAEAVTIFLNWLRDYQQK